MTLIYQAIHKALLPIALHQVPHVLDVFVEHIGRRNEKTRPKQTENFLRQVQSMSTPVRGSNDTTLHARASP